MKSSNLYALVQVLLTGLHNYVNKSLRDSSLTAPCPLKLNFFEKIYIGAKYDITENSIFE